MDQLGQRLRIKSEFFGSDVSQKLRAGLVFRVVEFFAGVVSAKMLGVLRRQERALMMVEPPRQQRRTGVFEVHNRVFVAVKNSILERMRSLVGHSRVINLRVRMNAFAVEAFENRSRGRSIETSVMKTKAKLH